jgi:hypothetical protein
LEKTVREQDAELEVAFHQQELEWKQLERSSRHLEGKKAAIMKQRKESKKALKESRRTFWENVRKEKWQKDWEDGVNAGEVTGGVTTDGATTDGGKRSKKKKKKSKKHKKERDSGNSDRKKEKKEKREKKEKKRAKEDSAFNKDLDKIYEEFFAGDEEGAALIKLSKMNQERTEKEKRREEKKLEKEKNRSIIMRSETEAAKAAAECDPATSQALALVKSSGYAGPGGAAHKNMISETQCELLTDDDLTETDSDEDGPDSGMQVQTTAYKDPKGVVRLRVQVVYAEKSQERRSRR